MTNPNKKLATNSATIDIDDLIIEILIRLPKHSIQRFKAVCRNWQTLIINPSFPSQWRKLNLKISTGLILRTRKPVSNSLISFSPNKPLPIEGLGSKLRIKQSCNGLLLCSSSKNKYYVYNPTNDMCHVVPELGKNIVLPGTRIKTMSLAFDPERFGSCFKVVCCVSMNHSNRPLHVHVYSSDTGVWKAVYNHRVIRRVNVDREVYWNGCIHWMYELTCYDIENEVFKVIPRPPDGSGWRKNSYFGESCDRLSCAKLWKSTKGNMRIVHVYELKRDYSEWVLKYQVCVDSLSSVASSVLSVVHGVEEEDSFVVLKTEGGIVKYNLVSKVPEELPGLSTGGGFVDRAFQYIESRYLV